MRIIVCLKGVPQAVTRPRVSDIGDRIDPGAAALVLNESDEYAADEAVALKKQAGGGTVTVVTVGRLPAQAVLQTGLAKGADKAVRIDAPFGDSERTAVALAEYIKQAGADLVLTGVESSDNLGSEVGVRIAEKLQSPYAYAVTGIEFDPTAPGIKVTKEVGGGVRQVLKMPLPALLCVQQGIIAASYVSVRALFTARSKPVESIAASELGVGDVKPRLKITDVFKPEDTRHAEMIPGKPPEVAARLMGLIRRS